MNLRLLVPFVALSLVALTGCPDKKPEGEPASGKAAASAPANAPAAPANPPKQGGGW